MLFIVCHSNLPWTMIKLYHAINQYKKKREVKEQFLIDGPGGQSKPIEFI